MLDNTRQSKNRLSETSRSFRVIRLGDLRRPERQQVVTRPKPFPYNLTPEKEGGRMGGAERSIREIITDMFTETFSKRKLFQGAVIQWKISSSTNLKR